MSTTVASTPQAILNAVTSGPWHLNFEFSDDYEWDEDGVLGEGKHDQPAYVALGEASCGENGAMWTYQSHGRIEVLDEEFLEEATDQSREALANAYLLAAAKDLLIALGEAQAYIEGRNDGSRTKEEAVEVQQTITTALRKASGEWHDVSLEEPTT